MSARDARRFARLYSLCLLCLLLLWVAPDMTAMLAFGQTASGGHSPRNGTVTIFVTPDKPANTFIPSQVLGAAVDGYERGDIPHIYTPANIKAMRSAGLKPLAYRLRTELGVEAWHWNPEGAWSDPQRRQGYWTSSDHATVPIRVSYGYRLPRRGNTLDQAGNTGYSRLDDGDLATFWKSNPYLDRYFTGEANDRHPQWIMIAFDRREPVNALRILFATPYATHYKVQYWSGGEPDYIDANYPDQWRAFPTGTVTDGRGGDTFLRLGAKPLSVRYVRILFTEASGTAPPGATDVRDRLGYAVRELYLGTVDERGRFHDAIRHGKSQRAQTILTCSSTDPWHRASDRNPDTEQPGFDLIFKTGLTNDLPMLTPVGLLYDTPENAAAEIRFLRWRGYPVRQVEMGEEPDGQYLMPEDYGALYRQWADAIHGVDPTLQLGGPGFQTAVEGWRAWPDEHGNVSWMGRFLDTLRATNRLSDFRFFSFEWYPFDDVGVPTAQQLARAPEMLASVLRLLEKDGVPRTVPWIITEYGYSSFTGQAEVDLPAALLNAEIVGQFLTQGGEAAYLYGYEPNMLIHESGHSDNWGNMALYLSDCDRRIRCPLPALYGARLLTQQWVQPSDGVHALYPAVSDLKNATGQPLVTAYAVHRPDGQWAVLLLNKDPRHAHSVRVLFRTTSNGAVSTFAGAVTMCQYSPAQYVWKANGRRGYPRRNLPPQQATLHGSPETLYSLPAYSLTVLRGAGMIRLNPDGSTASIKRVK